MNTFIRHVGRSRPTQSTNMQHTNTHKNNQSVSNLTRSTDSGIMFKNLIEHTISAVRQRVTFCKQAVSPPVHVTNVVAKNVSLIAMLF